MEADELTRAEYIWVTLRSRRWNDAAVMAGLVVLDMFLRMLLVVGPVLCFLVPLWLCERCGVR